MRHEAWEEEFPDETGAIRSLATYASELFPGRVKWQISDDLFAFGVRGARPGIWVALDQEIVVEVGRRHYDIPYSQRGIEQARRVLLDASR